MAFLYNDGGRAAAGFEGKAGDCVTRAIAIATGKRYEEVYLALFDGIKAYGALHRDRWARRIQRGNGQRGTTPRNGVARPVFHAYLLSLGWKWTPTMGIGTGCRVHLRAEELPAGRVIAKVSKHLVAVLDGVVNDTHDCTRGGTRCVYGYYAKEA